MERKYYYEEEEPPGKSVITQLTLQGDWKRFFEDGPKFNEGAFE